MESDNTLPTYSLDWAFAYGAPVGECQFKQRPEDFVVDELLPFTPDGEGEHLLVLIEKINENTDRVADLLARHAKVPRQNVSYAGRKDRRGITRQWFCITLPGQPDPNWQGFNSDTVRILDQRRHLKKLKTGALKGNDFDITLRDIQVPEAANTLEAISAVEARLAMIKTHGVPNYFGEQRFGHNSQNVERAQGVLNGRARTSRNKRSIFISAARSWLFNHVLSQKVANGSWNGYVAGDILGFPDSGSLIFDAADDALLGRIEQGEVSATSPLWGRGQLKTSEDALVMEALAVSQFEALSRGLENVGLNQERRVNRLIPENFRWQWSADGDELKIQMRLPKGCFATSVLRELLCYPQASDEPSNLRGDS